MKESCGTMQELSMTVSSKREQSMAVAPCREFYVTISFSREALVTASLRVMGPSVPSASPSDDVVNMTHDTIAGVFNMEVA